ncbi:tyrosine-type recombinase/integrase, partial [Micromonospora sp. DH15]|nr:tyrosine-type recombinase/integrase [Micromonospora sp. DH15]
PPAILEPSRPRRRRSNRNPATDPPAADAAGVRSPTPRGLLAARPGRLPAPPPHRTTPEELVFTGDKGAVLRSGNFRRAVGWAAALRAAGMPEGFHFHDLRHTGNNLAAATGASTRDLMHRMGHASMRAALVYQHANSERDREIAAGMDRRIAKQAKRATAPGKGKSTKGKAKGSDKPAKQKPTKGGKAERPAREPASDGTAGATGTPMARKIGKG